MNQTLRRLGIGLVIASLLLGCGQKGALYLPKKTPVPPVTANPAPASTAPESAPADSAPAPSGAH